MATKKSTTTSKTARVLNVISGEASSAGEDSAFEERQLPKTAPAPEAAPESEPARPPVPPILEMVRSNDEALSEQIRAAMEVELRHEPLSDPPPVQQLDTRDQPVSGGDEPRQSAEALEYINVMQALVEEKAPQFMELFGLCTCHRCVTDVKALTLTNLPPKYVVMRKGEVVPMLTVYEGRYNATIIAQLTQSCRMVMASPRHQR